MSWKLTGIILIFIALIVNPIIARLIGIQTGLFSKPIFAMSIIILLFGIAILKATWYFAKKATQTIIVIIALLIILLLLISNSESYSITKQLDTHDQKIKNLTLEFKTNNSQVNISNTVENLNDSG